MLSEGKKRGKYGVSLSERYLTFYILANLGKTRSEIMREHKVYRAIVKAVKEGRLEEPFTNDDFRNSCPGFGGGTYNAFLWKHRVGNPSGNTELFELVEKGKFRLLRPFKYGRRMIAK